MEAVLAGFCVRRPELTPFTAFIISGVARQRRLVIGPSWPAGQSFTFCSCEKSLAYTLSILFPHQRETDRDRQRSPESVCVFARVCLRMCACVCSYLGSVCMWSDIAPQRRPEWSRESEGQSLAVLRLVFACPHIEIDSERARGTHRAPSPTLKFVKITTIILKKFYQEKEPTPYATSNRGTDYRYDSIQYSEQ